MSDWNQWNQDGDCDCGLNQTIVIIIGPRPAFPPIPFSIVNQQKAPAFDSFDFHGPMIVAWRGRRQHVNNFSSTRTGLGVESELIRRFMWIGWLSKVV